MRVVLDIEADGLKPKRIWCIVAKDIDSGEVYDWVGQEIVQFASASRRFSQVIGHNIIDYDLPVLHRLCGVVIDPSIVVDTLVISRLVQFRLDGGHSLENWGQILKFPKHAQPDFSVYTPEMLEYCKADVELCHRLYDHLQLKVALDYRGAFREAIQTEHAIAHICQDMHQNGFGFNIRDANALYLELDGRTKAIEHELQEAFPPKEERKVSPVKKIERVILKPFNPASPKQIVERLQGFWKPKDKTEKGQAKINETNLATLSEDAPEACKRLVEYLLLVGRQRALQQWIDAYDETTGRVHPRFLGIGTWTHRMAHREPNLANIAAPKSIKYKGEHLSRMATALGGRMRGLWEAAPGSFLVGTDAEGIQLRIFGHYIEDQGFIDALVSGDKKHGTDPHSINGRILECDRDTAKTFIYAFLLGAGNRKIAEILGVPVSLGERRKTDFIQAYPGLERLRMEAIPRDAQRKFFEGFDGRLVACDSEHLMLAGYLQTGEACIMKKANIIWRKELEKLGIPFKQVNFVHDEWQTEVYGNQAAAEAVGRIQADSIRQAGADFGLRCPMAGAYRMGKDWLVTH